MIRLAMVAAATLMLQFCGSDDDEDEVPAIEGSGTMEVSAGANVAPVHGGTVVTAGAHPVEVVPYEDGTVHAFVRSPQPPPPAETQMTVHVTGDDGGSHPVVLVWDPSEARYRGHLRRVHPAPGPVEVVMVGGGQTYRGRGPQLVVVHEAAPSVVVERPQRPQVVVERPRAQVVVERPRSNVEVHVVDPRPRPHVVVRAPDPRPTVVVHRPGPPNVVVHHDNGRHLGHRRGKVKVRGRHGGRARVRIRH